MSFKLLDRSVRRCIQSVNIFVEYVWRIDCIGRKKNAKVGNMKMSVYCYSFSNCKELICIGRSEIEIDWRESISYYFSISIFFYLSLETIFLPHEYINALVRFLELFCAGKEIRLWLLISDTLKHNNNKWIPMWILKDWNFLGNFFPRKRTDCLSKNEILWCNQKRRYFRFVDHTKIMDYYSRNC